MISIQDVLNAYQYHTTFINTEPANPEFTGYLNTFDFDEVLGTIEDRRTFFADIFGANILQSFKTKHNFALGQF